ncbi:PAS domain-containing protein [Streptomyces sp. HU2014]|uniref:Diguanylate cyclase n=1 Tax=Streptomyces albireticuli TaxID=1940 RepID=A0A1Z2KY30_9ACTN|nr:MULTISPECIES: PAS domain-containing protein [Streptomyces]ARZ66954.1 diguanylate cyclase [Streptomyces albireticuli]UQI47021.1 PAS domain-containing protein [Streptomyces sp. HU2014]
MAESEELGARLADFRRRVEELCGARALPSHERLSALDAALFELQHAAEFLWPRYEALAARGVRGADTREQRLLRALFQRIPLAVVLLDGESVVRRLNFAATQLFAARAGFATGRSLTGSLRHDGRAAFRSHVAAVARGEGGRSLVVRLPGAEADRALRATLTALRPPGEPRTAVLAVFQPVDGAAPDPAGGHAGAGVPPPRARRGRAGLPAAPDPVEVTRHAELLDLVDTMATALLRTAGAPPERVLERAAEVLYGRFADWVVTDLHDGGRLRRVTVYGPGREPGGGEGDGAVRASGGGAGGGPAEAAPGSGLADAFARQDPASCPLVVEAAAGSPAFQVRPDDTELFGRDAHGAPLLVRAAVTSLLCVPLRVSPGAPVRGVLTLFRAGARRAFAMAEAGVVDRVSRHVALGMG